MRVYDHTVTHLLAEMERIDLLLRAQVARARRLHAADEQFQGLYISDEELDRLLEKPIGAPAWAAPTVERSADVSSALERLGQQVAVSASRSVESGAPLRLPQLVSRFGLDAFEVDCLLVCLAPELDLRYERLYAYLHDDVTRKRPSIDLVLSLLSSSAQEKFANRQRFTGDAPLVRHRLVEVFDDPSQARPPLLAQCLKLDERIVSYLLGSDGLDGRLRRVTRRVAATATLDQLPIDDDVSHRLRAFAPAGTTTHPGLLHLQGPYGSGQREIAEALCRERSREEGRPLLVVDIEPLLAAGDLPFPVALALLHREATLQDGALFIDGFDHLLADGRAPQLAEFVSSLAAARGLIVIAGSVAWEPSADLHGVPFLRVVLPRPSAGRRAELWSRALGGDVDREHDVDLGALATKFRFTGGQISDAAATARNLARWRPDAGAGISSSDLYEACRLHSNQKLRTLSRKMSPRYRWEDIVLAPSRVEQLRDICNFVKYRERVFGEWGFDRKLSYGKGLSALFAGPSGTGKTMAAEIIAGELELDLYKIDLSTVVSKFIGETEKNLSRVFGEAETSNAILFFDEADALFGKRSEVKDSHDRYANIEIGYLLQRIEEYEGVVILATNFRKNIDEAFVRRLHFTVDFQFPTEADRRRIWEVVWPAETPRDSGIDFDGLARRFDITGGNIKNIALAAAFFAADDGQIVHMGHLLRATHRELLKMGKIVSEAELVAEPAGPRGGASDAQAVRLGDRR